MPPRSSERALRKLVADLADRPAADIAAVLALLDAGERARVEDLMTEFRGAADASFITPAQPSKASDALVEGLSPWLTSRLQSALDGAPAQGFTMTSRSLRALSESAMAAPRRSRDTGTRPGSPGTAFYDLVTRWLGGPVR